MNRQLVIVFFTLLVGCGGSADGLATGDASSGDLGSWSVDVGSQGRVDGGGSSLDAGGSVQDPRAVLKAFPPRGSVYGNEPVAITGRGFEDGVRVWFGPTEGSSVNVVAPGYLELRTPEAQAGLVDITVEWPDGEVARLRDGFLYAAAVRIDAIEPASGPLDGGTPVVVRGEGFDAASRLFFGDRQALEVRAANENTLIAIAPAGADVGSVDVIVGGPGGSYVQEAGFAYLARTRIDLVSPASGPREGGTALSIEGAGFGPDAVAYVGGERAANLAEPEPGKMLVETPPGPLGPVDVAVSGVLGTGSVAGAFVYTQVEGAQGELDILGVTPPSGVAAGGDRVTVVAHGLQGVGPASVSVLFGSVPAEILSVGAFDVDVRTPAGDPGPVDVTLSVGDRSATLGDGFVFEAALVVSSVSPDAGPVSGGGRVAVFGRGFEGGVDEVRFGALVATQVSVVDDGTLELTVPPGAPGTVDVVVRRGGREARLVAGYAYRDPDLALSALTPRLGATAGGTRVHLFGAGFAGGVTVSFGSRPAEVLEEIDDGHLVVLTPPEPSGTVNVSVQRSAQRVTLAAAFSYYDTETGGGGTWGEPVSGAVNVVVLDVYTGAGVEGAFVVLGEGDAPSYTGWTDESGRITFSGPDLLGPQKVSAARADYSAASVVAFDASNVTLLLFPKFPPTTDPPPQFSHLGPGYVSGEVVWDDKYRLLPEGDCAAVERPEGSVLCLPCGADVDCGEGAVCTRIGQTGKYCTTPCTLPEGGSQDGGTCPAGFSCSLVGAAGRQCVPRAGDVELRCATTKASTTSVNPSVGDGAIVGPDMHYTVRSRLEELAVVCVASLRYAPLGPAQPFLMGVRRHIQAESGEVLEGQDIVLDIPLRSTLRVRLDDPPLHPLGDDLWIVNVYLDFGAEGVFGVSERGLGGVGDDTYLMRQMPQSLTGSLSGTSVLVTAGLFHGIGDTSHFSRAIASGVTDIDGDSLLRWDGEAWEVEALGAPLELRGLAADGEGRLWGVGEAGRIVRREAGVWYVDPSPTKAVLEDVWTDGAGAVWVAGQDAVVLHRDVDGPGWRYVHGVPGVDYYAVGGPVGEAPWVAGDRGVFGRVVGDALELVDLATSERLRTILVHDPHDIWIAGEAGTVRRVRSGQVENLDIGEPVTILDLVETDGGDILAFTKGGRVLARGADGWVDEETGSNRALYAAATLPDGDVVAVGDGGVILRRTALEGWTFVGRPRDRTDLRTVVALSDGSVFAAGMHNVVLSPLLGIAAFESPLSGGSMSGHVVSWSVSRSVSPTIQYLSIASNGGYPVWDIFLDSDAASVRLPDFESLAGFGVFGQYKMTLTLTRIYHPSLDVDHFSFYDVWFGDGWPAWSVSSVDILP